MNKEDYYSILGVDKSADSMEIKKAYKKLAMKYHPDRNSNDKTAEFNFKKIGEAYEVLSNPKKRQTYDQYGHSGFDYTNASNTTSHFTDIFSDIFGDIFGDYGNDLKSKNFNQRGTDLLHVINITLEDAAKGVKTNFKINTYIKCHKCLGSGAKDSSSFIQCNRCNGYGQIKIQQGFIIIQQTCNKCQGQGSIIKDLCITCHGNGRVKSEKTLSTQIPAGINNDDKIRLSKEGEFGKYGGEAGDLYIQVKIKSHLIFTRKESNIYCEIPISVMHSIFGGELEIPHLNGKIKIKIPKETQTNKIFRIKNKGIKNLRDLYFGDLFCKIIVETPVNLNLNQINLLNEFNNSLIIENKPKENEWIKLKQQYCNNKK